MNKRCAKCKTIKDSKEFSPCARNKDGKHAYCRSCHRAIVKAAYHLNPRKKLEILERTKKKCLLFVNEIKEKRGCLFCPEKTLICLEFHHLDPQLKKENISRLVNMHSLNKLEIEIKKCVVVCSNCHRKIHAGLLSIPISYNS